MIYLPELVFKLLMPKDSTIIGTGATSVIYKHEDSDKVYGITTDKFKLQWLEYNKDRFQYKLLESTPYVNGGTIYTYEMLRLTKLTERERSYAQKDVFDTTDKLYRIIPFVGLGYAKQIKNFVYSAWMREELDKVVNCFGTESSTLELDLHIGQVMKLGNQYVIIDPVFEHPKD